MKKVLVVDDDESIASALTLVLEDEGYTVHAILKGEETIREAIRFQPNVILLDLLLSGKDGSELCQDLKQNEKTRTVPIIMISAHPNARTKALESGANDFLAKPFDTDELLKKVSEYAGPN